ncbi:hypothetical protein CXB51_034390 [Gossypium anomalum]|uniref:Uncharacterized protein n=1 Tax=Gossypium anomalum TaxID=47600 RepID=A0A8J5XPT7_9ROSI|nr:hypothetical protein CXB51_034390 [Gossypium anomalum]
MGFGIGMHAQIFWVAKIREELQTTICNYISSRNQFRYRGGNRLVLIPRYCLGILCWTHRFMLLFLHQAPTLYYWELQSFWEQPRMIEGLDSDAMS